MIRVGDKIYSTYNMSVKGEVREIFYVPVTAGLTGGPLSKRALVKIISESDGLEYILRQEDVRKQD
jgi:hypothetical protein